MSPEVHRHLRQFSVVAALGLSALVISGVLGTVALNIMPCSWFGSSFEGTCAFRAFYSTMGASLLLSLILFVAFTAIYRRGERARSAGASLAAADGGRKLPVPQHMLWWHISFWVVVGAYGYNVLLILVWNLGYFIGLMGILPLLPFVLLLPLLLVHSACAFLVARPLINGQEMICVLVAGITAPVGTIALYCYMRRLINTSNRTKTA